MNCGDRNVIFRLSVLTALVLVTAIVYSLNKTIASEQFFPLQDAPSSVELWITEGKVTGSLDNLPLSKALEALRQKVEFEYRGVRIS